MGNTIILLSLQDLHIFRLKFALIVFLARQFQKFTQFFRFLILSMFFGKIEMDFYIKKYFIR